MTADENEDEFDPSELEDGEYDPSEPRYRDLRGPKDINAADWWKNGPRNDD